MKKYILVDAISSFRIRYAVSVPADFDDVKAKEWAGDSVTCEDVEEFSQEHIGEQISSMRILSEEELLAQFDEDNDYLRPWSNELKLQNVYDLDKDGNNVKKEM